MQTIESGLYQFRIKYEAKDGSLAVDYTKCRCNSKDELLRTYEHLKSYHRDNAKGEITITHTMIGGDDSDIHWDGIL